MEIIEGCFYILFSLFIPGFMGSSDEKLERAPRMLRNYIGLAVTHHDPAVAIVDSEGEVVFAEAIERAQQVKRAWNCVPDDINRIYPLIEAYCEPGVEIVAARTWSPDMAGILRSFFLTRPAVTLHSSLRGALPGSSDDERYGSAFVEEQARWLSVGLDTELRQAGNNLAWRARSESEFAGKQAVQGRVIGRAYDHHLTHAAAACYSSPFEEAACAVIDGYGEKASLCFYQYRRGALTPVGPRKKLGIPTSLGVFYLLLCRACGFDPYKGEEWKVMGLAPYGSFDQAIYDLLRPLS